MLQSWPQITCYPNWFGIHWLIQKRSTTNVLGILMCFFHLITLKNLRLQSAQYLNLTTESIDGITVAVATYKYVSHSEKQNSATIFSRSIKGKAKWNMPVTSSDNVFITEHTLIAIQSCYCMLTKCFTPFHNINPLFPTYKMREWIKRSNKHRQ
jgi:hypothetical protein